MTIVNKPSASGKLPEYPTLTLPSAIFLDEAFQSAVGEEIRIEFSPDFVFEGNVTIVASPPEGGSTVLGATDGVSQLNLTRERVGSYRGFISHRGSPTAHRISTAEDGSLLVEQVPYNHIICAPEGATPEAASGLVSRAGSSAGAMPTAASASQVDPALIFPSSAQVSQPISTEDIPILDSLPSAAAVIYLDFDGQTVTGTSWNTWEWIKDMGVVPTIVAAPSNRTAAEISEIWSMVAEDFAPFNIAVTTSLARFNAAPQGRRMRVIFTPSGDWYNTSPNNLGVAFLGSFRLQGDTPCWVFERQNLPMRYFAVSGSHEVGHTLDLKHDGGPGSDYLFGVETALVSWNPIMGGGVNNTTTQWSKGEYAGATNTEDDLAIITNSANGFGYQTDDKGDTIGSATPVRMQGASVTSVNDGGIIEKNTDVDVVRMAVAAGTLNLTVGFNTYSPNLEAKVDLLDAFGNIVSTRSTTKTIKSLAFSQSVSAGTYYLRVEGVGLPVPVGSSGPYAYDASGYGSIGRYSITGSIPATGAPPVLAVDQTTITQSTVQGQNAGSQSFGVRNAGGGTLSYTISESISWSSVSPLSGNSTGASNQHSITYSASGLSPGTYNGNITVTAAGASGSPQNIAVNLTVAPSGGGTTFSNSAAITIPSSGTSGASSPYPSSITVSGVTQNVASVAVDLKNLTHGYASDLDILLVAPNGQTVMLVSDAGGQSAIANATLTIRDDAGLAPEFSTIGSGGYRPTNFGNDDVLPAPAPIGPHGNSLAAAVAGGVNGTWLLYVADDFSTADGGVIASGWSLSFTTTLAPGAPTGVSASDGTFSDRVRVTWGSVTGATSFTIHRSQDNNSAGSTLVATVASPTLTWDDTTVNPGETYYYWVRAVNSSGTSPFSAVNSGFRIASAASNDNFVNRFSFSGNTANATASSLLATKEPGEPNHAGNTGGKSLWWTWTAPSSGTLTVDTLGSNFDTLLGVYTGSTVSGLVTRASDDDSAGGVLSRVVLTVSAGTSYQIAVDGQNAISGTVKLQLSFLPTTQPPPTPASLTATDGTFSDRIRVTWSASANTLSYDVHRNTSTSFAGSSLIANVSGTSFDDTTAVSGQTYNYWVVARNASGTSAPVGPDSGFLGSRIDNDFFANGSTIIGTNVSVTGSSIAATKEAGEPNHGGNTGGKSVWWRWTAPQSGSLIVDTIGSNFDTLLGIYTGSAVSSLTTLVSDDDGGGNLWSRAAVPVTAGVVYHIAVDGFGGVGGSIKLQLAFFSASQPPPPPLSVSASDGSFFDRVQVAWQASLNANSYDVHRGTTANFAASSLVGNTSNTSFSDTTASLGQFYYYWVVARNAAGASAPAGPDSGFRPLSPPANDNFEPSAASPIIGLNFLATTSTGFATKQAGEPDHGGNSGGASLWWSWTATQNGTLVVRTAGSNFDTLLGVYTGSTLSGLTTVASNDDTDFDLTSRVELPVTGGTTYHIAVDGFRGDWGTAQVQVQFIAPRIIGLAGDLNFGSVTVGQPQQRTLTLTNSGGAAISVVSISYPAGFSGPWTGTLPAGGSQDVTVTFAPLSAQYFGGTVTVNTNATGGINTTLASGTGVAAPTRIIGFTGSMVFGSVAIGEPLTKTLTITNAGNSPLNVASISYPSGFSGDWSTGSIPAGGTQDVGVTFSPSAAQSYGGSLTVNSDATLGSSSITLSGTGFVAPTRIIGLQGDLGFGGVTVGQVQQRTLVITNNGTASLGVTSISYPIGFTGNWTSGTIPSGGSQAVTITFAPTAVQAYGGTITVLSNAPSGTNTIAASGSGLAVPTRIIGLIGDLAFGNATVGQVIQRPLTITNTGTSALNISSMSFPSGFSGNFAPVAIPAGGTHVVTVSFAPTAEQVYSGAIAVGSDATSGGSSIAASGFGVDTASRVLGLSGNLSFGNTTVGQTAQRTLVIANSGNSPMAITGISHSSSAFAGSFSGSVAAGGSQNVTISFSPSAVGAFTNLITVSSNATSGSPSTNATGQGVADSTGELAELASALQGNDFVGLIGSSNANPAGLSNVMFSAGILQFRVAFAYVSDFSGEFLASGDRVTARMGGAQYKAVSMTFDRQGKTATATLIAPKVAPINVSLNLSMEQGLPRFTGNATVGGQTLPVVVYPKAFRGVFGSVSPLDKRTFNCVMEADLTDSIKTGHGFFRAKFAKDGSAAMSGRLPDGRAFTGTAFAARKSQGMTTLLLVATIKNPASLLIGELDVPGNPGASVPHLSGNLLLARSAFFGFPPTEAYAATFAATGLRWDKPFGSVLTAPVFRVLLDREGVTPYPGMSLEGSWPSNNKPVFMASSAAVKVTFSAATGAISLKLPGAGAPKPVGLMLSAPVDLNGTAVQGLGLIPQKSAPSGTLEIILP